MNNPLLISPYPRLRRSRGRKSRVLECPSGFLWGSSTSAYQVEGGISNNDWATQGRLAKAGQASDHYRLYESDFRLAKKLHQNAHRLSIEWSRIQPEEGEWNDAEIEHYSKVLFFLKNQGLKTFVTLHHLTNPVWATKSGGWENPEIITNFVEYAAKIAVHLGQLVDFWITINEPGVYASLGYAQGIWPPFEKNYLKAYRVYDNMMSAHNKAYDVIHGYYPKAQVGLAQSISFKEPAEKHSRSGKLAVKIADYIGITRAFKGIKQDFLGVNHYFYNRVKLSFGQIVKNLPPQGDLTDKGWEIYPRGLYEVLLKLKKYDKPIYITENGIADAKDLKRAKYITDYLQAVYRAMQKKVPVKGYFYWSLLDNFEWPIKQDESGFDMRFGLIKVDFTSQKRTIRKSAKMYAEICKNNSLTPS